LIENGNDSGEQGVEKDNLVADDGRCTETALAGVFWMRVGGKRKVRHKLPTNKEKDERFHVSKCAGYFSLDSFLEASPAA
jgi:hypothetical protein